MLTFAISEVSIPISASSFQFRTKIALSGSGSLTAARLLTGHLLSEAMNRKRRLEGAVCPGLALEFIFSDLYIKQTLSYVLTLTATPNKDHVEMPVSY